MRDKWNRIYFRWADRIFAARQGKQEYRRGGRSERFIRGFVRFRGMEWRLETRRVEEEDTS